MSDNAGCYKSSQTLLKLHHYIGDGLVSYDFSEAQNGKGPCDRRASHVKSIIRRYINQGHDVISAKHMKQSIDQGVKKDIKVKVAAVINDVDTEEDNAQKSIPFISQMYDFEFHEDKLVFYRAYNVGKGKTLSWDKVDSVPKRVELSTVLDWGKGELSRLSNQGDSDSGDEVEHNFECPNEGCAKQFKSAKCLDEHVIIGNCYSDHTKLSVTEKAKSLYSERLQNLYPSRNINLTEDGENSHPARVLGMGWALKADKVRVVFSDKQKEYMLEKYNQGKITGQKVDPYLASAEMRTSGRFTREEFLSGKQISSHFSRLCQNEKKTTKGDYKAAKVEENKAAIKTRLVKLLA